MSEREDTERSGDDDLAAAIENVDDTGLIRGEELITRAEMEHPELFDETAPKPPETPRPTAPK